MRLPGRRISPDAFALALLLASTLQIMENLVPRIPVFPWLKFGLSYVVILPVLLAYGPVTAFALLVGRNLLGVLYGGQIFSTFLISTGAGAFAFLGLGGMLAWAYHRKWVGLAGVSVVSATAFNVAQLVLVEWVLIGHAGFYFQIAPLLAWSIASGLALVWLIRISEADLNAALVWESRSEAPPNKQRQAVEWAPVAAWKFPSGLGVLALVLLVPQGWLQVLISALLILTSHRHWKSTLLSLRAAWPLMFYLAWLHLYHTPGKWVIAGMTQEGIHAFGFHSLRLFNLVLVGHALSRVVPVAWMKRSRQPWWQGMLIALPLLPGLFTFSASAGKQIVQRWRAGDRKNLLTTVFDTWKRELSGNPGSDLP